MTTSFNSWYADRIDLTFGVFAGVKGKVWVDDVQVEEVGLMNVIRRDGAPLTVRDEKTGTVYKEGVDFAPISDPDLISAGPIPCRRFTCCPAVAFMMALGCVSATITALPSMATRFPSAYLPPRFARYGSSSFR